MREGRTRRPSRAVLLTAESERHANRSTPVIEILEAEILVDEVVVRIRIVVILLLQATEITHVAAQPHGVAEEEMHAATKVDPQLIGAQIIEQILGADVC